ncbi:hypothetical protein FBU31_000188, partial [Coemansia sp. 'formosensis']
MDDISFDYLRSSIDQLAATKQLLLACMDTPDEAVWTQPSLSVDLDDGLEDNLDKDLGADLDEPDAVEPLAHMRLDEIKRDVGVFKSTWESLREQYPPGKSDFAPLSFTASKWAAIASTDAKGLSDDLEIDEAYSQSAAMTAYGVELLRKALSGPQVNRRLTTQVLSLLSTLCAMLTDSQCRHRAKVTRAVGEMVESFKRARSTNEDPPAVSTNVYKRAKQSEPIPPRERPTRTNELSHRDNAGYLVSPMSSTHGQRAGRTDTSLRSPAYDREYSSSAEPLQLSLSHTRTSELNYTETAQNSHLTRQTSVSAQSLETDDSPLAATPCYTVSNPLRSGGIASTPPASTTKLPNIRVLERGVPKELHRQYIIREALLRWGWTTPAIDAYFDGFAKSTN